MDTQYKLETTEDPDRPWAITRLDDDSTTFTFAPRDESFAREILDNLNAGRAWEPALATESLEDTDSLADSA